MLKFKKKRIRVSNNNPEILESNIKECKKTAARYVFLSDFRTGDYNDFQYLTRHGYYDSTKKYFDNVMLKLYKDSSDEDDAIINDLMQNPMCLEDYKKYRKTFYKYAKDNGFLDVLKSQIDLVNKDNNDR